MCHKMSCWERRPGWLNGELSQGLRKSKVYHLWQEQQATQEQFRDLLRSCREHIRKAKAQLELNLPTAVRDNNKRFLQQ